MQQMEQFNSILMKFEMSILKKKDILTWYPQTDDNA